MAPVLDEAKHDILKELILDAKFSDGKISKVVKCSIRAVRRIRSNLRHFGSTKAPLNGGGRRAKISPLIKSALNEHLLKDPTLYQKDLVPFLKEQYGLETTETCVHRALQSLGQARNKARQGAGGRAKITPRIRLALHEQLLQNPTFHHGDLVFFLKERYGIEVTKASVCRALQKFRTQFVDQNVA